MTENEKIYLDMALENAKKAGAQDDVPIGAVIVDENGMVLSSFGNMCEQKHNPLAHAEMLCIEEACKNRKFLLGCTIYTTLEPCPMCTSALIHTRIKRIVYSATDTRMGAVGGLTDLTLLPLECHPEKEKTTYLEQEQKDLLSSFFKGKRGK